MDATVGRYQLRRLLGHGGMGEVHLAWDPQLEREVAIKTMRRTRVAEASALARFQAEARALARLSSPHVVQIHDMDFSGDPAYLVMEMLPGGDLGTHLRRHGPFDVHRLRDLAAQLLDALVAAHRAGILHRDLKPANILIGLQGQYKLADFGLAQLGPSQDLTSKSALLGTVRYMAPESFIGVPHDQRSDLFSLGLILGEAASGTPPYGKVQGTALHALVLTGPGSASTWCPGLPPQLIQWLDRLIAERPENRFASAASALAALDELGLPPGGTRPLVLRAANDSTDPTASLTAGRPSLSTTGTVSTLRPTVPAAAPRVHAGAKPVRFGFSGRLALALWLVASIGTGVTGFITSQIALDRQLANLRSELLLTAGAAAQLVHPADLDGFRQREDAQTPAYQREIAALRQLKAANPDVRFLYAMRNRADSAKTQVVEFILDTQIAEDANHNGVIDPDEEPAWPGKPYSTKASPRMLDGFANPVCDDEPNSDQWGTVLSGYAPIRRADGSCAGLIGVDIDASRIDALRRSVWIQQLILQGCLLLAFLTAALLIARRFNRPVQALRKAMLAIAQGDLDAPLPPPGRDEFGLLTQSLHHLVQELREAAAVRAALERVLSGGVAGELNLSAGSGAVLYLGLDLKPGTNLLALTMPRLVASVRSLGGTVEGVLGSGFVAHFPGETLASGEQALRAGLAMLTHVAASDGLTAGVAVVPADVPNATRLAASLYSASRGVADLAAAAQFQLIVRRHFYADTVTLPGHGQVYAIKGAVSG